MMYMEAAHFGSRLTFFAGIKRWFGTGFKSKQELELEEEKKYEIYDEEMRIRGKRPIERDAPKEKA